jgi:dTMP kinase
MKATTTAQVTTDTSVTLSLVELARLEAERLRSEEAAAQKKREAQRMQQKEAERAEREAEMARLSAEAEERARKARAEAEEKVRAEARARVESDILRIQAEAKARLQADEAARAHELAVIRAKAEGNRGWLRIALVAVIAISGVGGVLGGTVAADREAALRTQVEKLRDESAATARSVESARTEAAERQRRLTVEQRERRAERVTLLDGRRDALAGWAEAQSRRDVMTSIEAAADRAHAQGASEADLAVYDGALTRAADQLSKPATGRIARRTDGGPVPVVRAAACANPHDPMCGLDGRVQ